MSLDKYDQQVIGAYMEIRATAQDLDREIFSCLSEVSDKQPAVQLAVLSSRRLALDALYANTQKVTDEGLALIDSVSTEDPKQRAWAGDQAVHVRNELVLVASAWPAIDASMDAALDRLRKVATSLDRIVYLCESLTLTPRLADVLDNVRVGQALSVEALLSDELPRTPALRTKLFGELADQNGVLEKGYYDAAAAIVYRVASTRAGQRASVVRLLIAILGALALVTASCLLPSDWPFHQKDWPSVLMRCAFLFSGVALHGIIQGITVARRSPTTQSHPWNDWVIWINAHEMQLLMCLVPPVLLFVFLGFTMPGFTWQTAFFAGYSIDSLTDVVLDRFSQLATARGAALLEAVTPKPSAARPAVGTP